MPRLKRVMFPFLNVPWSLLTGAVLAALASWIIIGSLVPWLSRRAVAFPNDRSSHTIPTPQGGGLGVVGATLGIAAALFILTGFGSAQLWWLALGLAALTMLGLADDMQPLGWRLKLAAQTACAMATVEALPLPEGLDVLHRLPLRLAAAAFLVTTVNIVNFVDGIDEITAAHTLPSLSVPVLLAAFGTISTDSGIVAACALGAVIGFWLWNRHPARIFLGDCGSLPLGLLLGWLALVLSLSLHPLSGLTILLYPLADGGLTLLRRLLAREDLTKPHRQHAYQRAVDAGIPPRQVAGTVGLISLATALLCLLGLWLAQPAAIVATAFLGTIIVIAQVGLWHRTIQPLLPGRVE